MKKRNLIIGGVLLIILTAAAVFFAVNSLAAPSYPSGVADIKSGEVKVVFENLPTEYIEVKELYSLQYYMEKYPKAKEIMGYYKGTLYYWTKDEKKVLFLGGLAGSVGGGLGVRRGLGRLDGFLFLGGLIRRCAGDGGAESADQRVLLVWHGESSFCLFCRKMRLDLRRIFNRY